MCTSNLGMCASVGIVNNFGSNYDEEGMLDEEWDPFLNGCEWDMIKD